MNIMLLLMMIQTYITVCCDLSPNVIVLTIVFNLTQFSQYPLLYNEEWSMGMVLGKLMNGFFCFTILTILNMLLMYIAQIRSKLAQLIFENLNLLDGMHEGLIVLSAESDDKELQLASRPAIRLIQQLPDVDED